MPDLPDKSEDIEQFQNELRSVLKRVGAEYDLTYATIIGCLHLQITELTFESMGIIEDAEGT